MESAIEKALEVEGDQCSTSESSSTVYKGVTLLADGRKMPTVGLGTYKVNVAEDIYAMIDFAFEAGYRHFDTATAYDNEEYIGTAI